MMTVAKDLEYAHNKIACIVNDEDVFHRIIAFDLRRSTNFI